MHLPPLRQRRDDIPLLAEYFLDRIAEARKEAQKQLSADGARGADATTPWPGNVRELENALERAVILTPGDEIDARCAAGARHERVSEPLSRRRASSANPTLEAIERAYIMWVLQSEGGNKTPRRRGAGHRSVDALPQAVAVRRRGMTLGLTRGVTRVPARNRTRRGFSGGR